MNDELEPQESDGWVKKHTGKYLSQWYRGDEQVLQFHAVHSISEEWDYRSETKSLYAFASNWSEAKEIIQKLKENPRA